LEVKASDIVRYLDEYVISQDDAKKQLAILIKNKMRYDKITEKDWKKKITPFNALIIGPTGSGKTELFRTLAEYLNVAFTKVDISSYTKTGYVGKSVDEIISVHLYEAAKRKAIDELKDELREELIDNIAERLAEIYIETYLADDDMPNTIVGSMLFQNSSKKISATRDKMAEIKKMILNDDPEIVDKELTVIIHVSNIPQNTLIPAEIREQLKQPKPITDTVKNLKEILFEYEIQEAARYHSKLQRKIKEYMENGIVFIDEIDKIAGKDNNRIDSAGVQKELLTLIEGTTVMTDVGPVKTDHILFIAAGAFHTSKPTDLLPELLGRLPIRIVLNKLTKEDLKRILIEPKYSILDRIKKLYEQDGIIIEFTEDAIDTIAEYADKFNNEKDDEYLGARRLHSLVNMITEDIDFEIEEGIHENNKVVIDKDYVTKKIEEKKAKIDKALEYIDSKSSKIGFVV